MTTPIIIVDGAEHRSWTRATVRRSLEEFAHSWSVEYIDRWAPDGDPWVIIPGAPAVFQAGVWVLVTGYVTRVGWRVGPDAYTVTAEGRSETADLVDCAPFFEGSDQASNLTVGQLADALAKPFDIAIDDQSGDTKKLKRFVVDLGETCFDVIDRVCRGRGILPMTTSDGRLLLTRSSNFTRKVRLPVGQAITRSLDVSEEERFNQYFVYGQHPGEEKFRAEKIVSRAGVAGDGGVRRYRPTIVLAESPASQEDLALQASWVRNVRAGRARQVNYRLGGTLAPDNRPWEPGVLCQVEDPILRIKNTLLVSSVTNTWDVNGIWSDLTLAQPESYSEAPFPDLFGTGGL